MNRQLAHRHCDKGEARREIVSGAGNQPHACTVTPSENAEVIMLDFVKPAGTGRRSLSGGGQTRFDNPQSGAVRSPPVTTEQVGHGYHASAPGYGSPEFLPNWGAATAALIFCLRQIKAAARRRRALTKKYNLDCKSLFFSSAAVSLPKVSKKLHLV